MLKNSYLSTKLLSLQLLSLMKGRVHLNQFNINIISNSLLLLIIL